MLAALLLAPAQVCPAQVMCLTCHTVAGGGLVAAHKFLVSPCSSCHLGDERAGEKDAAHQGLVASPGQLGDAAETCGRCHTSHLEAVRQSHMHTGRGIVQKTRKLLGSDQRQQAAPATLQTLGDGIPDSLLRKLCAGCHLGRTLHRPDADPLFDRGGGCLACHLGNKPEGGHANLGKRIEDQRCLGCHSRSARISLNYAGLAEVDPFGAERNRGNLAQLADDRLVRRVHADSHHRAGMSCIDCHTGPGLMGFTRDGGGAGVDIRCEDCHANLNPKLILESGSVGESGGRQPVPFASALEQPFWTTSSGTPLWHVQLEGDEAYLHPKLGGPAIRIPQASSGHVPLQEQHRRLSCDACHAQWAPTCLGCHVEYDPEASQWDYREGQVTPGAWKEARWDIDASQPTLGLASNHEIQVFVPGMIMTLAHPQLDEPIFLRHFSELSPHTTGEARECDDCHRSSISLGLGKGNLSLEGDVLQFSPTMQVLQDGLPADAWTSLLKERQAPADAYPRPFNSGEIKRIFSALPEPESKRLPLINRQAVSRETAGDMRLTNGEGRD